MQASFNDSSSILVKNEKYREVFMYNIFVISENLTPKFRKQLESLGESTLEQYSEILKSAYIILKYWTKGDLALSLSAFTFKRGRQIPPQVAKIFLRNSNLAIELCKLLHDLGVPQNIWGGLTKYNQSHYENIYHVYIAGLIMCMNGCRNIEDISAESVRKWLSYYYNPSKKSFKRPDLVPETQIDVHKKIFKVISIALGKYFHDPNMIEMGKTRRTQSEIGDTQRTFGNPPPHLKKWADLWGEFRKGENPLSKTPWSSVRYLFGYLSAHSEICISPADFLGSSRQISFYSFYKEQRTRKGLAALCKSDEFAMLNRFSAFVDEQFKPLSPHAYHPLIPAADFAKYRSERKAKGLHKKLDETDAMPLPYHIYKIARTILLEAENGWPGQHPLCKAFLKKKERYVPVLPTFFLTMFELPLRAIQVRRLDSGEGDTKAFDGRSLQWAANMGKHAGYWKQKGEREIRGYAHSCSPTVVGFEINTNKHSPPFVIPWQNEWLHELLFQLRVWQETWNPIEGPIQLIYDGNDPEQGAEDRLPVVFPLFRMPAGRDRVGVHPISYSQYVRFWLDLLLEAQNRWNAAASPEDREEFVAMTKNGKQVLKSIYMPHGMRVAGIMVFLQAGFPPDIISRFFAGHATILQTLYYLKHTASYLARKFEGLSTHDLDGIRADIFGRAKDMDRDAFREHFVFSSEDALERAMASKGIWQEFELGICPFAGMKCGDGSLDKKLVEGGEKNCLLCRHFLTGPAYAHAIWARANYLLFQISQMNKRVMELSSEVEALTEQLDGLDSSERRYRDIKKDIIRIENLQHNIATTQGPLAKTCAEAVRLLHEFEEIERTGMHGGEPGNYLIASEHSDLRLENVSTIEQLALLAGNAEIYRGLRDPLVTREMADFVNNIAIRTGFEPVSMTARTAQQQERDIQYAVQRIMAVAQRQALLAYELGAITVEQLMPPGAAEDIFAKGLRLELLSPPIKRPTQVEHR